MFHRENPATYGGFCYFYQKNFNMDLTQNEYNIIYVFSAVVNIIILICFFVMVTNIGKIKKKIVDGEMSEKVFLDQYYKYRNIGQRDLAAKALHDFYWLKIRAHIVPNVSTMDNMEMSLERLQVIYKPLFDAINEPVPKHLSTVS